MDISSPVDLILSKFDKVNIAGNRRWQVCCPAHEDRHPSLSITECDDGSVRLHCFAGCDYRDVLAAIGLQPRDLYPIKPKVGKVGRGHRLRTQESTSLNPSVPSFPAADLLRALCLEAVMVNLIAESVLKGTANQEQLDRLALAQKRFEAVLKAGLR
jgi:hypothetical protein